MIFLATWLCDLTLLGEVFLPRLKHPEVTVDKKMLPDISQTLPTVKLSVTEATAEDRPRGGLRMEKNRNLP